MDIRFTYSTVLTAVILSSVIFVSLFLYIGKKDTAYSMAEVYAVMACFLFSLVRLVFPIEILHLTKSIYLFKVYPIIYDCLKTEIFPQFRIAHILCGIWILGAVLVLGHQIYLYRKQRTIIKKYGRPAGYIYTNGILGKECRIRLLELDYVSSSFVMGVFHPTIILPAKKLKHKDLILRHEIQHVRSHDLFLKCLFELLFIIYWWNPLVFLSRFYFGNVLELRNDLSVVKELSSEECADYATTLTETAREKNGTYMTAQFNGHFLAARIKSIVDYKSRQKRRLLLVIPLVASILSIGIVLEPATPPDIPPDWFFAHELNDPKSYLDKTDHGYNLYIKGRFIGRIDEISDDFKDLRILGGD